MQKYCKLPHSSLLIASSNAGENMERRKNLVVVRCGDNSLHLGWDGKNRNWDLAVSYFGQKEDRSFPEAELVHRFRGGKWDGIKDFFISNCGILEKYDFYWLPDDDIEADCSTINEIFDCMRRNSFELAQPSLAPNSFLSHLVSAWNPLFEYRNVNFVEIMVPTFSAEFLRRVLPLFDDTKSGFGVDFIWQRFTKNPSKSVAVIDSTRVLHTRAVGGALRKMMEERRMCSPDEEQVQFLAAYQNVVKNEMVIGGQLLRGPYVGGPKLAATIAALGWIFSPTARYGFTSLLPFYRFWLWVVRNWTNTILQQVLNARLLNEAPTFKR